MISADWRVFVLMANCRTPIFLPLGDMCNVLTIHTNKLMVRSDSRPVLIREYGSIYTEATRT